MSEEIARGQGTCGRPTACSAALMLACVSRPKAACAAEALVMLMVTLTNTPAETARRSPEGPSAVEPPAPQRARRSGCTRTCQS
jgi:hypothetical protein